MQQGASESNAYANSTGGTATHGLQSARRLLRRVLPFLPTLLAIIYYGWLAAPRFESEAQFIVRTASKPAGGAGLGAFLQMTGIARAQDDAFSVQSYFASRDAVKELGEKLPLRDYFGDAKADWLARYPSLIYGASFEDFYRYFNTMVTTLYSSTTGITTLRVQAFEPEHARGIANELLDLGERVVNRMNDRITADSVRLAEEEVRLAEERTVAAQVALTAFRNRELMIDPIKSSVVVSELIARLSAELAQTQAQITEARSAAPDSPALISLGRRAAALEAQIQTERQRISSDSDGLALKLSGYERLLLMREYANQSLSAAHKVLETSRVEARRKQLYLERVVEPVAADYPMQPRRLRLIATAFGLNCLFLLVGWLVTAGYREHMADPT